MPHSTWCRHWLRHDDRGRSGSRHAVAQRSHESLKAPALTPLEEYKLISDAGYTVTAHRNTIPQPVGAISCKDEVRTGSAHTDIALQFTRGLVFTGKFSLSTPEDTAHRTGVHTDETSTPLEGPWTPLQQPYSISHRAGPRRNREKNIPVTGRFREGVRVVTRAHAAGIANYRAGRARAR